MIAFEHFRRYFIAVCLLVVWMVVLVALLLAAYCAIRWMGVLYHRINEAWFEGREGFHLILAAVVIMALGLLLQAFRTIRISRANPPPIQQDRYPAPRIREPRFPFE